MPQKFSAQSPRDKILYQLEKANYYPLKHHQLLKQLPRSINAQVLINELITLEEEGLIERIVDKNAGKPLALYTLSERYAKDANFQIVGFQPNL